MKIGKLGLFSVGFLIGCVVQLSAQSVTSTGVGQPDYLKPFFGFYHLNIPGYEVLEGSKIRATYVRITGKLNAVNPKKPFFVVAGRDPIPLSFAQASVLLFEVRPQDPFDLLGFEGTATDIAGRETPFFVAFEAVQDVKAVNLVPAEPRSTVQVPGSETKKHAADQKTF